MVPQIIGYSRTWDLKACGRAALGSLAVLGVDLAPGVIRLLILESRGK